MRVTIDLPEALYRKTQATAALQGISMKDLIVRSIEREIGSPRERTRGRISLPILPARGRKVDLAGFDLDDLLA